MSYQKIKPIFLLFIIALSSLFFHDYPVSAARLTDDKDVTPTMPMTTPTVTPGKPQMNAPGAITMPTMPAEVRQAPSSINPVPSKEKVSPDPPTETRDKDQKEAKEETRYVTIDFDNVDIDLFIKFISELTGKNFVIDSGVKGKVTIISPAKISVDEAYKVFESVLEVHGFSTVPAGNIIKIVPAIDARSKAVETRIRPEDIQPEDKMVTQLIPLKYADPDELKKVFAPFISKSGIIVSYKPTGMLIITDILSNIKRLLNIVDALDIPGIGEEISVVPLEHAMASTLSKSLDTIFKRTIGTDPKTARTVSGVTIVPDDRTNTLIIMASEDSTIKIKEVVKLLDKETPKGEGDIRVYYLQNANAEELAKVLMAIPSDAKAETEKGKEPVVSKEVRIMADKSTNSLIITAKKADYLVLEDVIKKLDIPRRMVYIEALIMEVSATKEFDLGVQWMAAKPAGTIEGRNIGVFGGSVTGTGNFPSATSSGTASLPTGFSLGVLGDVISIGGIKFPNIGAVIRAYHKDSDVNIISTPQILTTDNEEAQISVGENVPFITRQDTTTGTDRDYTTYEYKDVGVTLKITPQINQERFVRLKLYQEVKKVKKGTAEFRPTTLTRTTDTTVIVKDENTVVIGGIIGETDEKGEYKVPILGDIPILGNLFRSKSSNLDRTNLFIFLTPHIIENPIEAKNVYDEKKGQIDTIKEGTVKLYDGRPKQSEDMKLCDKGYSHLRAKDYEKAMKYYQNAIKINPENPYALLNMGVIYETQGEMDKASEMYKDLISLDPDERAFTSSDPAQIGRKLSDIARDNLKRLEESR